MQLLKYSVILDFFFFPSEVYVLIIFLFYVLKVYKNLLISLAFPKNLLILKCDKYGTGNILKALDIQCVTILCNFKSQLSLSLSVIVFS